MAAHVLAATASGPRRRPGRRGRAHPAARDGRRGDRQRRRVVRLRDLLLPGRSGPEQGVLPRRGPVGHRLHARRLRRGVPHAPARRPGLRPAGRPHRPHPRAVDDGAPHGGGDRAARARPDARRARRGRPGPRAGDPHAAGVLRRRGVHRRAHDDRGVLPGHASRGVRELAGVRHHHRLHARRGRERGGDRPPARRRPPRLGLAAAVPAGAAPRGRRHLPAPAPRGHPGLPAAHGALPRAGDDAAAARPAHPRPPPPPGARGGRAA